MGGASEIMSYPPNTTKEIQTILKNLESKERKKENEQNFSKFLYLRTDSSREFDSEYFDAKKGVKIFGIKGPEDSVYEKLNLDVVFKYDNQQWNASFDAGDICHPNVSTRGQVSLNKNSKDKH